MSAAPAASRPTRAAGLSVRQAFDEALDELQGAVDVPDSFDLLRRDTGEWPRYEVTLETARRIPPGVIVDLGGYFGVIARAASRFGHSAHVVDSYSALGTDPADLAPWWESTGMACHDIDLQASGLRLPFDDASVDLVTLLAVIEHFPSTPRLVLEEAHRILKPGGVCIVDTPNAGYFGTRVGFALHGGGIWADVGELYRSDIPFPGHKRCYNRAELVQVLEWAGFGRVDVRLFDLDAPVRPGWKAQLLYGRVYPALARRWPDLRGYLWLAATKA